MNNTRYNGWTNYETWAYNLWKTNDSDDQADFYGLASGAWQEVEEDEDLSTDEKVSEASTTLAGYLKTDLEENSPLNETNNVYSDLLQAAIDAIDFYEVAENAVNEVKDQ